MHPSLVVEPRCQNLPLIDTIESPIPLSSQPAVQDEIPVTKPASQEVLGWSWECDASGRFSYCSEEVLLALGIPAERFLGRLFTRFQLSHASIDTLDEISHFVRWRKPTR